MYTRSDVINDVNLGGAIVVGNGGGRHNLLQEVQDQDVTLYLSDDREKMRRYVQEWESEVAFVYKKQTRFSQPVKLGVPERNMIRALRMMPAANTPEDWGRLHVWEWVSKGAKFEAR